jgi:hypothetical protein
MTGNLLREAVNCDSRFGFQPSTTNVGIVMSVIPNWPNTNAAIRKFGATDTDNAGSASVRIDTISTYIEPNKNETGTVVPITFATQGTTAPFAGVYCSEYTVSSGADNTATSGGTGALFG